MKTKIIALIAAGGLMGIGVLSAGNTVPLGASHGPFGVPASQQKTTIGPYRSGKGQTPHYAVVTCPVATAQQAVAGTPAPSNIAEQGALNGEAFGFCAVAQIS